MSKFLLGGLELFGVSLAAVYLNYHTNIYDKTIPMGEFLLGVIGFMCLIWDERNE